MTEAVFTGPDWPADIVAELALNAGSGRVGTVLVSETDRVRVWHLTIRPGERLPFHRHVNDYFWTALSAGRARSRYESGEVREVSYTVGETRHYSFGPGESMLHDLANTGDTDLAFVTVEFLRGPNRPLPVGG